MISEISVEELKDIAYGSSVNWRRVDSYLGDERRWGHDRWIVFCENSDLADKFYRFSFYEGSGDSEIDFEPTPIELVQKVEKIVYAWEKIDER